MNFLHLLKQIQKRSFCLIVLCVFLTGTGVASAAPITDYLIWGEGVISDSSTNREGVFVGPGSVINGNVGSRGDVQTNGTVGINGDVYSGSQTIFSLTTTVSGTVTEDGSDFPTLPTPTVFTSGGDDYGGASNNGTINLAPGSYGVLSGGGGWDLNLSSGNYYFDSIHFANATDINLDLSGGAINIFVTGELFFGADADVILSNGGDASMIYWETHEADTLNAFRAQGGSDWLGTVYAPYGGIHFGSGSGPTTFEGYFWSGWNGGTAYDRSVYIEHGVTGNMPSASVPEPATMFLLGSGLAFLGVIGRKKFKN